MGRQSISENNGKEKNKPRKIPLKQYYRSKLNSIEKIRFNTLIDSNISHEEPMLVINE